MPDATPDTTPDATKLAVTRTATRTEEPGPISPWLQAAFNSEGECDVAKLRELVELDRQVRAEKAEHAYAAAMHACQQEMPTILRDARNERTRSLYVRLETVQKDARPIYAKHGFALSFSEDDCPLEAHKRTACVVRHRDGHSERHHLDLPLDGVGPKGEPIGGMNRVQGSISTTTYGQRRLLCMIFNITVADEDRDGNRPIETLSEEQAAKLQKLLDEREYDEEAFWKYVGIEKGRVRDIPASKFQMLGRLLVSKPKRQPPQEQQPAG